MAHPTNAENEYIVIHNDYGCAFTDYHDANAKYNRAQFDLNSAYDNLFAEYTEISRERVIVCARNRIRYEAALEATKIIMNRIGSAYFAACEVLGYPPVFHF
jgi:hypothetical protein